MEKRCLKFKKEDFAKMVKKFSFLIKEGYSFYSNYICFNYDRQQNKVIFRINSNEYLAFSFEEIYNSPEEPVIEDTYILDFKQLKNILNHYKEDYFTLYEEGRNNVYIEIFDNKDRLECFSSCAEFFNFFIYSTGKKLGEINKDDFFNLIEKANLLFKLEKNKGKKNIYFDNNTAFVQFLFLAGVVYKNIPLIGILREKDTRALKNFFFKDDDLISVFNTKTKIIINDRKSGVIIPKFQTKSMEQVYFKIRNFKRDFKLDVDKKKFYNILEYLKDSFGSTGYVKLYSKNKKLFIKSEKITGLQQEFELCSFFDYDFVMVQEAYSLMLALKIVDGDIYCGEKTILFEEENKSSLLLVSYL